MLENWKKYILLEGRKENAISMIVKKIQDPWTKNLLQNIAANPENAHPSLLLLDPTPNKKYIEWAARRINDLARRKEDEEHT